MKCLRGENSLSLFSNLTFHIHCIYTHTHTHTHKKKKNMQQQLRSKVSGFHSLTQVESPTTKTIGTHTCPPYLAVFPYDKAHTGMVTANVFFVPLRFLHLLATMAALEEPNFRKLAPICLRMLMSLYLLGNLMGWLQGRERVIERFHLHAKRLGGHINC